MALASVDVDRLLHDTLRSMNGGWAPPCNAYEDEHGFHIQVAVPGVDRQDMRRQEDGPVKSVTRCMSQRDAITHNSTFLGWIRQFAE